MPSSSRSPTRALKASVGGVAGLDLVGVAEVLEHLNHRAEQQGHRLSPLVRLEDHRAAEGDVLGEELVHARRSPWPRRPRENGSLFTCAHPTAAPVDRAGGQRGGRRAGAPAPSGPRPRRRSAWRGPPRSPTPISSSIETRSSVEMLPGGARWHGAAAELAEGALERLDARSSAASTLARPWPRVLWKCAVSSTPSSLDRASSKNSPTCRGLAIPVVSPKATSSQPNAASFSAISKTRSGGTSPSYGQPKLVEITPSQRSPASRRDADRSLEIGQRFRDRAVDVLAVVRLRGREEEVGLLEAVAEGERVVEPLAVRDQHRIGDVVAGLEAPSAPRRRPRAAESRQPGRTR